MVYPGAHTRTRAKRHKGLDSFGIGKETSLTREAILYAELQAPGVRKGNQKTFFFLPLKMAKEGRMLGPAWTLLQRPAAPEDGTLP